MTVPIRSFRSASPTGHDHPTGQQAQPFAADDSSSTIRRRQAWKGVRRRLPPGPLFQSSGKNRCSTRGHVWSVASTALFLREPTERRRWVDHRRRYVRVPIGIACHERVAGAGFRSAAHTASSKSGQANASAVGRRRHDGATPKTRSGGLRPRERMLRRGLLEQIENRGDAVSGHHAMALSRSIAAHNAAATSAAGGR